MKNRETGNFRYSFARNRVKAIKGFYIHLAAFVFVNGFILLLNYRHSSFYEIFLVKEDYAMSNFVLWGIVLFVHWASVFGVQLIFGKKWEEQKLQELMKKEKKGRWE